MNSFPQRLAEIMRLHGIPSVHQLGQRLGYARSERVRKVMAGENLPGYEMLADIARTFATVNYHWLLTGEGAPIAQPLAHESNLSHAAEPSSAHSIASAKGKGKPDSLTVDPPVRYGKPRDPVVVTVDPDGEPNIVMLDSRAAAGLPGHYQDPEFFRGKPVFSLPGWKFRGQGMIAIQITGDSMAPTIHHNDWVVARHLVDPSEEMKEGYIHILVTRDGAVAKRLFRAGHGREALVCKSDNDDYPSYEQILGPHDQLYVALGLISEDLSRKGGGVRDRVRQLEKDVQAIQHKLNMG